MFLVGIFQWWYGPGWLRHVRRSYVGVLRVADTFSVGLLAKTLFNPFKQISAADVSGGFPVKFQAFLDRLFSRVVGMVIRTFTILLGLVVIAVRALWTLISVIAWTLLPLSPIIGIVFWISGVTL